MYRFRKWRSRPPLAVIGSICFIALLFLLSSSYNGDQYNNQEIKHLISNNDDENLYSPNDNSKVKLIDYDRSNIKFIYPELINSIYDKIDLDQINWKKFAYVLYATSKPHACNAIMIMEELTRFKTRAEKVILVKQEFLMPNNKEYDPNLILLSEKYNIILKPVKVRKLSSGYWTSSFTKLLIFNQIEYERVIYIDSDALIRKGNMDELFFLPPAQLASVSAYWLLPNRFIENGRPKYKASDYDFKVTTSEERLNKINKIDDEKIKPWLNKELKLDLFNDESIKDQINQRNFYNDLYNSLPSYPFINEFKFSSIILVVQPSKELFNRVQDSFKVRKDDDYDMDMLNYYVFKLIEILKRQKEINPSNLKLNEIIKSDIPEFLMIPHQIYGCLTQELNLVIDHKSFLSDPMDQPFLSKYKPIKDFKGIIEKRSYFDTSEIDEQSSLFKDKVKYFHFSDSPIPKPWIKQNITNPYMKKRARCSNYKDFKLISNEENDKIVKPDLLTKDCAAGEFWEGIFDEFKTSRKRICGLDLIINDDFYSEIN